jgi:hypothetical protein
MGLDSKHFPLALMMYAGQLTLDSAKGHDTPCLKMRVGVVQDSLVRGGSFFPVRGTLAALPLGTMGFRELEVAPCNREVLANIWPAYLRSLGISRTDVANALQGIVLFDDFVDDLVPLDKEGNFVFRKGFLERFKACIVKIKRTHVLDTDAGRGHSHDHVLTDIIYFCSCVLGYSVEQLRYEIIAFLYYGVYRTFQGTTLSAVIAALFSRGRATDDSPEAMTRADWVMFVSDKASESFTSLRLAMLQLAKYCDGLLESFKDTKHSALLSLAIKRGLLVVNVLFCKVLLAGFQCPCVIHSSCEMYEVLTLLEKADKRFPYCAVYMGLQTFALSEEHRIDITTYLRKRLDEGKSKATRSTDEPPVEKDSGEGVPIMTNLALAIVCSELCRRQEFRWDHSASRFIVLNEWSKLANIICEEFLQRCLCLPNGEVATENSGTRGVVSLSVLLDYAALTAEPDKETSRDSVGGAEPASGASRASSKRPRGNI